MLRPRGYGIERLRAAEAKSVDKANGELKNDLEDLLKDARLSCKYLGVDRDGTATPDVKAKKTSLLHFEWRIKLVEYDESHALSMCCDNACKRGAVFSGALEDSPAVHRVCEEGGRGNERRSGFVEISACGLLVTWFTQDCSRSNRWDAWRAWVRGSFADNWRHAPGLPFGRPV